MAQRDMTKTEFNAALRRNGFKHEFMGWYVDTTGQVPSVRFGAIFNVKPFRINRRATLARLIRDREKHVATEQRDANKTSLVAS